MINPVEQLDEAIDALLTLDPDTLTDPELDEVVVAVQRQRARLGVVAAQLVERWDRRQIWADDQSRSPATRLARDTNTSVGTARVELRRGRHLAAMPVTEAAVVNGELSLDHVELFGRATSPDAAPCSPNTNKRW